MTITTARRTHRLVARGAASVAAAVLAVGLTACGPPSRPHLGTFTPNQVDGGARTYTDKEIITEAKAVGVRIERVRQVVGEELSGSVATFQKAGIESQLTIKASRATITPPLVTAEEREAFRTGLDHLLDHYRPPLLSVENEATADNFYAGTPAQYLTELRIATNVAKAHGVPITDSGIPWPPIALVAWHHVLRTQGTATANAFLATVFREGGFAYIRRDLTGVSPTDPDPFSHLSRETMAQSAKDAETILDALGTDSGDVPVDYVNFHWYVPDQVGGYKATGYTDAQALRDAVAAIKARTNGKQVVTNEVGQRGLTPAAVTGTLQVLINEVRSPFVIWFDADGIPARALFDDPGHLRENGKAFAAF